MGWKPPAKGLETPVGQAFTEGSDWRNAQAHSERVYWLRKRRMLFVKPGKTCWWDISPKVGYAFRLTPLMLCATLRLSTFLLGRAEADGVTMRIYGEPDTYAHGSVRI